MSKSVYSAEVCQHIPECELSLKLETMYMIYNYSSNLKSFSKSAKLVFA